MAHTMSTGATHSATIPNKELHVVLVGFDTATKSDTPLNGIAWDLSGAATATGTTDATGAITEIVNNTNTATLKIQYPGPTSTLAAEPTPAAAATDYPVKIQPGDFKDTQPANALEAAADRAYEWSMTLVALSTRTTDPHVLGRLFCLGFPNASGASQTAVVQAYQWVYKDELEGSGALADIKNEVIARHDDP